MWGTTRFGVMIICMPRTAQRASIVNWRQRHQKVLACAPGDFCAPLALPCRCQRPRVLLPNSRVPCSLQIACPAFMHRLLSLPCATPAHRARSARKMALPWRLSVLYATLRLQLLDLCLLSVGFCITASLSLFLLTPEIPFLRNMYRHFALLAVL